MYRSSSYWLAPEKYSSVVLAHLESHHAKYISLRRAGGSYVQHGAAMNYRRRSLLDEREGVVVFWLQAMISMFYASIGKLRRRINWHFKKYGLQKTCV